MVTEPEDLEEVRGAPVSPRSPRKARGAADGASVSSEGT